MENNAPYRFRTISDYHGLRGLPAPEHPLINVINLSSITLGLYEPD